MSAPEDAERQSSPDQSASSEQPASPEQTQQQSQRPPQHRGDRGERGDRRDRFQRGRRPQRDRQGDSSEGRERQGSSPEGREGQRFSGEGRVRQGGYQESRPRQNEFQEAPEGVEEPQERPERQGDQRSGRDRREGSHERRDRREGSRGERDRRDEFQGGRESGGKELSVVVPLYNEEQSLRELYDDIRSALSRINRYEIIFVDDGSTDNSARVLQDIRQRDKSRIKIIRFRRNFGKSAALAAGFQLAQGSIVVTMDADLQDDPAEIPSLMNEIKRGNDLVSGWKKKRKDPITKTIPSRFFNFITRIMTGIKIHDFNCGLKAYRKDVVKEVRVYGELHRYIPVLAHWLGYKVSEVPVRHRPRRFGKTKFGVGRFWKGFLDLLTVLFTTRYLQRPLHLFGFWGSVFVLFGSAIDLYLIYLKFYEGASLSNRPLFTGGILFIIVGIQFISVGLLGEMITKTRQSGEEQYSIRETWK